MSQRQERPMACPHRKYRDSTRYPRGSDRTEDLRGLWIRDIYHAWVTRSQAKTVLLNSRDQADLRTSPNDSHSIVHAEKLSLGLPLSKQTAKKNNSGDIKDVPPCPKVCSVYTIQFSYRGLRDSHPRWSPETTISNWSPQDPRERSLSSRH